MKVWMVWDGEDDSYVVGAFDNAAAAEAFANGRRVEQVDVWSTPPPLMSR